MAELPLQDRVLLLAAADADLRLWRNNVGQLYAGKPSRLPNGRRVLLDPRPVRCGVGGVGAADVIGLRSTVVTPDMVGMRLARFVSLEVKQPGGRTDPAQRLWREVVTDLGALAGVVESVEGAELILADETPR